MIAIVGGGMSGLALGHFLGRRGVDYRILEAAPLPGGVVATEWVEGQPLDLGPQRTRYTRDVADVVRDVGLERDLILAPEGLPLLVYRRGGLRHVPLSLGDVFRTDLLRWPGKLRILLEPLTGGARPLDTVERFLVRKFGREAYEALLGPLYGGLYGSDPARMLVRHGLAATLREMGVEEGSLLLKLLASGRRARDAIPAISFREGMEALPRAMASAQGSRVRLHTSVQSLRPGPEGGWQLETSAGPVDARTVVLTTPADASAWILKKEAPEAARRLESLHYNWLAVVHLRGSCGLRGLGYQVAFDEPLETRGVTWNACLFGRTGVHTAFLGGMRSPELVDRPDEAIAEIARREFEQVTGCRARPMMVSRTRMPAWDVTWEALDELELPAGVHVFTNYESRPGIPGRITGARRLAEQLALEAGGPRPR